MPLPDLIEIVPLDKHMVEAENRILEIQLKQLEARKALYEGVEEEEAKQIVTDLLVDITRLQVEIIKNNELWKRSLDPIYDAYQRTKESMADLMYPSQVISETLFQGGQAGITGLTEIGMNITGGFQAQRQEVVELEGELKELQKEYNEALSEGNLERVKEINQELATLNKEISDLENPLKQTGEMFRKFFIRILWML